MRCSSRSHWVATVFVGAGFGGSEDTSGGRYTSTNFCAVPASAAVTPKPVVLVERSLGPDRWPLPCGHVTAVHGLPVT